MYTREITRYRPVHNVLYLFKIHRNTGRGDDETQVFEKVGMEAAFGGLRVKTITAKSFKDNGNVSNVFFEGLRED